MWDLGVEGWGIGRRDLLRLYREHVGWAEVAGRFGREGGFLA